MSRPTRIEYKGFTINPRKLANLPIYIAWVYGIKGDMPGFKVSRADEPAESVDRIIEIAKWEIDQLDTKE